MIITGRQDSSVGYKDAWRLSQNYPRATCVVFDRAGHFLEEKEPLIGPLLNEWLDRVEEVTPPLGELTVKAGANGVIMAHALYCEEGE